MRFKFFLASAAALLLSVTAAEASASYQFTIDTSSLAGTSGAIELQIGNSGVNPFQDATATISNFQGATLANIDPYTSTDPFFGAPDVLGTASGILPATLVLDDNLSGSVSDYLQPLTFGNSISFLVTLAGPAIDASDCAGFASGRCSIHDFGVDFFDSLGNYAFVDPLGSAFQVGGLEVDGSGIVTAFTNPGPDGASALAVSPVPEPAAWTLMLAGLGALFMVARRRALI